jgi:hypothetical protein
VLFWNFLMAKHTCVHFILSLFLYKYVFLQHVYRVIVAIAGCNQFNTSSCNNEYPGNTAKVDAEEADRKISLAKMSLIRTKPDHFYDI